MADITSQANIQKDNGRSFMSSLVSKLPFMQEVLETETNNPRYELFDRLSKRYEMKVMKQSVLVGPYLNQNSLDAANPANVFGSDKGYHQYIYANIDVDKQRRLSEYRRMAAFAEVADCLDEICDEFINKDERGQVIKLVHTNTTRLTEEVKTEIEREFYKFIQGFNLEGKGWGYCRRLLTEGELFFENIVHEDKKDKGIIGALSIPGELINPIYDNVQNNVIQNFLFQKPINFVNQSDPRNPNFNPNGNNHPTNIGSANALQHQMITLEGNQVTYIDSGIWNDSVTIKLPFIENCRRAYKLLSLLEDSIIIYRMVRAPERLKFVIDVGNMPPAKAEAYVKSLMQKYWTKKTYDSQSANSSSGGGSAGNIYDPQSMLDSFWFAKRAGEQGSDVQLLQGGQNLGQLDDLNYFVLKLYKSLKVPTSRLNPNETFKDGAEILKEELRFAKFIVRLQNQFSVGLKTSFVTHLKLRGLWSEHKLQESFFNLEMVPPSNFFAIRQQQLLELKLKNFETMSGNEGISNTYAQRYYLEMSDAAISENMEWKRKDAGLAWEIAQIEAAGPNWKEQVEAAEKAATEADVTGGSGGGESAIPEFGGAGEAETEGGAEAQAGAATGAVAGTQATAQAGASEEVDEVGNISA
jgi:hypothetical protein